MTRHKRTLSIVSMLALLTGLLVAIAHPTVRAQDDTGSVARPAGFPAEIALGDQVFRFDRELPVAPQDLVQIGSEGDLAILAASGAAPYGRVFVASAAPDNPIARYLPEIPVGEDATIAASNACPAEPQRFGDLERDDDVYAYAGLETDIPLDTLAPIATTADGSSVYATSDQEPPPELLLQDGSDLARFILLDEQGRPVTLGDSLQFQGASYGFAGDATATVDQATLAPVGCAGPFRVSAPVEEVDAGTLDQLYVTAGTRLLAFQAAPGTPAAATAAVATPPAQLTIQETPASETEGELPASGANLIPVESAATPAESEPTVVETPATEQAAPAPATEAPAAAGELPATAAPGTPQPATDREDEDLPLEVVVAGARFALDRSVPVGLHVQEQGLEPVGQDQGVSLLAPAGGPPFARVYGAGTAAADRLGRYLAELPIGPDGAPSPTAACVAETTNYALLDVGGMQYAYAGPEPDLTSDQLQAVLTASDGQPVYAESAAEPFRELFFPVDSSLERFVLLDDRGVPTSLGETIVFDGQRFTFERDASAEVDAAALSRAGCVGPFSARVDPNADAGNFDQLFLVLIGETPKVLAFMREGGVETSTNTPVPPILPASPTATLVPPTATLVPPTATPVPPTTTPIPPTTAPIPPTATTAPATQTPAPPPATPSPAQIATQVIATEMPVGTVSPAAETPPPLASPVTLPSDVAPTPLVLPTVAPPPTPVSAIPLDAPPPIPDALPQEILVQGIRYTFDLQVDIDPNTLIQVDVVPAPETTLTIFAAPENPAPDGPFPRVYAVPSSSGIVARYVSEAPITPTGVIDITAPCPAEANPNTFSYTFDGQQYAFDFASVEQNLSIEELRTTTVAALGAIPRTDDGREILVRAGGYPGLAEVFLLGDQNQLQRYIALNAAGLPVTLNDLVFAETRFDYEAQVSVTITESAYRRIGCSGAFPLFAPVDQAQAVSPLAVTFTLVDNRVYQFRAAAIVTAPTGQAPVPPAIVPPPPGYVQITLQTTVVVGPTPTPLPNIRIVPVPTATGVPPSPTPVRGLVVALPPGPRPCPGDPGAISTNGLPERLPSRIQLSGVAYNLAGEEEASSDITLIRIGCVGPFEAVQREAAIPAQTMYLRTGPLTQTLYRFDASSSFTVDYSVSGDARVITSGNERYLLQERWPRSLYSSVTVIVFAQNPTDPEPTRVFALPVDGDVIAEYVREGGDVVALSPELQTRAEAAGINPDLVLGGDRRYLLVALWSPIGTTTNGWVTLYAAGDGVTDTLLATDPRSLDLFIYRRSGTAGG